MRVIVMQQFEGVFYQIQTSILSTKHTRHPSKE